MGCNTSKQEAIPTGDDLQKDLENGGVKNEGNDVTGMSFLIKKYYLKKYIIL